MRISRGLVIAFDLGRGCAQKAPGPKLGWHWWEPTLPKSGRVGHPRTRVCGWAGEGKNLDGLPAHPLWWLAGEGKTWVGHPPVRFLYTLPEDRVGHPPIYLES